MGSLRNSSRSTRCRSFPKLPFDAQPITSPLPPEPVIADGEDDALAFDAAACLRLMSSVVSPSPFGRQPGGMMR